MSAAYHGLPPAQYSPPVYDTAGLEVDTRDGPAAGLEVDPGPPAPQLAYSDDPKHFVSAHGAYYDHSASPSPPQVVPADGGAPYYAYQQDGGGGGGGNGVAESQGDKGGEPGKRRRKPLWIAMGVVAAVIVIAGAVVGGVVGSRQAASSSSSVSSAASAPPSPSSSATPADGDVTIPETAAALQHIRPLSRLAVTGWREGSKTHARLFYQGPDQKLRYSNRTGDGTDAWTAPIVLDDISYAPAVNTSLAASVSLEILKNPQWKLFFLDGTATIRNQVFDHLSGNTQGNGGTFNEFAIPAAPTSRLASYWPFLLSQNGDGALRWTRYWGSKPDRPFWENQNITLKASDAAGLVAVPAKTRYLEAGAVVYRRDDGKLFNYFAEQDGKTQGTSWANGNLAKFSIPAASALGGFTVARSSATTDNAVDTHLLYQDAAGVLQTVWQDDAADWKGPQTHPAFAGADAGTDIACLAAAAWDSSGVSITAATDLACCFFQVRNQVREVHWTGSGWESKGFLPID